MREEALRAACKPFKSCVYERTAAQSGQPNSKPFRLLVVQLFQTWDDGFTD